MWYKIKRLVAHSESHAMNAVSPLESKEQLYTKAVSNNMAESTQASFACHR